MGQMTRYPINPLGSSLAEKAADIKELGQLVSELELQLLELLAANSAN